MIVIACPLRRSILVVLFIIAAVFVCTLGTNVGDVDSSVGPTPAHTITTTAASATTASSYGSTSPENPENSPKPVFLSSDPSAPGNRFIVLVLTRLGWANRIRCIADW